MVNWGIIGCGGIARRRMVPALPECKSSRVIAVMDVDRNATNEVAAQIGARPYYSDTDLLADPDIQAVYIAIPVHMHAGQTLRAAAAGKHVLVEKPLSLSLEQGREMVDACNSAGVYLVEGYMMKYHALHVKARELVAKGSIGNVVFARGQLACWYPEIPGAWRQDPKLGGGGALMDMATHCYDLLEYIIGSPIKEVFAFTNNLTFHYPVEDSATTLLRFENGAQGIVDSFFDVPDAASQGRLEIYGNKGSMMGEGTIGQTPRGKMVAYLSDDAKAYNPKQDKESLDVAIADVDYHPVNMYAAEMDYLSECISHSQPPEVNTGEHGLHILEVALAAYESARTGSRVTL